MAELDASAGFQIETGPDDPTTNPQTKWASTRWTARSASAVTTSASNQVTLLDLGAPARGRLWEVMAVSVMGNNEVNPITNGLVSLWVTAAPTWPLPFINCVRPAVVGGVGQGVPNYFPFSRRGLIVNPSEHLIVAVYTQSITPLVANANVWDMDVDASHEWNLSNSPGPSGASQA